jgi:predicted ATPase/class 3 adenylate cyclase
VTTVCPSCGAKNAEGARFCSGCAEPLLTQAGRRERKFATALFADLVGSTALGEREDPEVVQSLIGEVFDRLSTEITRHGGLIEKFIGDGILALFGVPDVHEDDSERAVRAALEIQAVLSELNRSFVATGRPEVSIRIGIDAGEVLVDLDRTAATRDRMLTGDAVNTASRLQGAAEPGTVVVGQSVYEATRDVVRFRELIPLELKGKREAVPAWEALSLHARAPGARSPGGLEAALVGRDDELGVLEQTLQRVRSNSRPALVTVLGDAGVGKSRLLRELLADVDSRPDPVYWRSGRCLSYGAAPYSALADVVKAQAELLDDDPPAVISQKVDRAVDELFGDHELAPHLLTLVGVADREFAREKLFDAWRQFLERLAARYPLILALEDLHWADAGLLDFIDHLAEWGQGPIYVLATARPELLESRPGWGGGKRNYAAIYLDPLSPSDSSALIDGLLSSELPAQLKDLLVERSGGNPLFAEEIVRMLIDRGALHRADGGWQVIGSLDAIEIPRSIHGLIAARIDSLPPEEKSILQEASIVGRIFWLGATARLTERSRDEALELLERLRVKELVVHRAPPAFSGEQEFGFRHALIRDVAYESLPKSVRIDKHVALAEWAEERAGGEENAQLLASHYAQALTYLGELGRAGGQAEEIESAAGRWAIAAGRQAMRVGQPAEAAGWFRRALQLAGSTGSSPEEHAGLWESYGDAADGTEPYAEVVRAYEHAYERYERLERDADAGRVEAKIGLAAHEERDEDRALRWLDLAVARLEPLGDSEALAGALASLGNVQWRRGRPGQAVPTLRRSVAMARRVGARAIESHALDALGVALLYTGNSREGLENVEASYEVALESGDLGRILHTANNLAASLMFDAPDYARGERLLSEALELARRSGRRADEAWLVNNLANYAEERGDVNALDQYGRMAAAVARSISYEVLFAFGLSQQAAAALARGQLDTAQALIDESGAILGDTEPQAQPYLALWRGGIAAARLRPDDAISIYLATIEKFGGQMRSSKIPELLGVAARALWAAGRTADARALHARLAEASENVQVQAQREWTAGCLAEDPDQAATRLRGACEFWEGIGRRILAGRCLVDLAEAERRLGDDPLPTLERARVLLTDCGAELYVRDVDAVLDTVRA